MLFSSPYVRRKMARPRKKTHELTEAEILKLGRKAIHRLTPEEKQILNDYWDERLKKMGWGIYRAEDTHMLAYLPQKELECKTTDEQEWDSAEYQYAWNPPSGSVRDDILEVFREAVRPYEPCGGGRQVGPERFRWLNSISSDTSVEDSPMCREKSAESA